MLLTKTAIVKWNAKIKTHYIEKGYIYTKMGDEFEVKVEDLTNGSHADVQCLCDYCLEEGIETITTKEYREFLHTREKINKDSCKKCKSKKEKEVIEFMYGVENQFQREFVKEKSKETSLDKYGTEYPNQNQEVKNKIIETVKERYGVDNIFKNESIKEKSRITTKERYGVEWYVQTDEYTERVKQTNLSKYGFIWHTQNEDQKEKVKKTNIERYGFSSTSQVPFIREKQINTLYDRYGVYHPSHSDIIKEKTKQTNLERYGTEYTLSSPIIRAKINKTLYKNGTAPCSKQQIHINNTIGGELNYPVDRCLLDIAFPDEMIYVEYDGGGHDLCVKMGDMSEKDFKNKERRRYYALKGNGWKNIRIISRYDYLPSNQIIVKIINDAKDYLLNQNHSWIIYDIDNNVCENSLGIDTYDFGKLRKIDL